MSITWTGIYAETPFSSSSVLAVPSFLAGFPNTVTVTGPGGGTYSALVRIHDANGNVVGTVPVSSSAALPASMSLPEGSDRYGYSLVIVSGAVPTEGVMIQVRGGLVDRFPAPPMSRNPTTGALEASGPIAVVSESGATEAEVRRTIVRAMVPVNTSGSSSEVTVALTFPDGMTAIIPSGTFLRSGTKDLGRKLTFQAGYGFTPKYPNQGLTLRLRHATNNIELMKWYIDPRKIAKLPSSFTGVLEVSGWMYANGQTNTNIELRSHTGWELTGFSTTRDNENWAYGRGAGSELLPKGNGTTTFIDGTQDIPFILTMQWDTAPYLTCVREVGPRFGILGQSGEYCRTARSGISNSIGYVQYPYTTYSDMDSGKSIIRSFDVDQKLTHIGVGDGGSVVGSTDSWNWQALKPITTGNLYSVMRAEWLNLWVAVGAGGFISTSPDGNVWTNRTSGTALDLWKISGNSTVGLYVITSETSGTYLKSTDGIVWTVNTLSTPFKIQNVAMNAATVLMVGSNNAENVGKTAYYNGSTWAYMDYGTQVLRAAVYAFSKWTIVGSNGTGAYSATPGTSWAACTIPAGSGLSLFALAYCSMCGASAGGTPSTGIPTLMVVGSGGYRGFSLDGITFAELKSPQDLYFWGDQFEMIV